MSVTRWALAEHPPNGRNLGQHLRHRSGQLRAPFQKSFTPPDLDELFGPPDVVETLDIIDHRCGGWFSPLLTSTMVRRRPTDAAEYLVGYWAHACETEGTTTACWKSERPHRYLLVRRGR